MNRWGGKKKGGVRYYNDSIATTPDRTEAALRSFAQPIILLAGGSDKKLSYAGLGRAIHGGNVKKLILFGATAPAIRRAVLDCGDFPLEMVQNLEQAVALAGEKAEAGDVVCCRPLPLVLISIRILLPVVIIFAALLIGWNKKEEIKC